MDLDRVDDLVSVPVTAYGRGINQFAQGSGATAMPSQRDGLYRESNFSSNRETVREGIIWSGFPVPKAPPLQVATVAVLL